MCMPLRSVYGHHMNTRFAMWSSDKWTFRTCLGLLMEPEHGFEALLRYDPRQTQ